MSETNEPRTEREFIAYRFTELKEQIEKSNTVLSARLDRMEQTMNNFGFTKQADHDKLVMKVEKLETKIGNDYVTKESVKPWQTILIGITIAVGGALAIAIIKVVGDML